MVKNDAASEFIDADPDHYDVSVGLSQARASLHGLIVPRLRAMILTGELPPTAALSEAELSRQFDVSRTPLREALKVLAAEGLVVLRAHRSPVVAGIDPDEIAATFETILPLEVLAGRLATERADATGRAQLIETHAKLVALHKAGDRIGYLRLNRAFHLHFASLSGNPVLRATLADLLGKTMRARASANLDRVRWEQASDEHRQIIEAFIARRSDEVAALLTAHGQQTAAAVLAALAAARPSHERPGPVGQRALRQR